jgi:2Fe-2S ferredoxin
MENLRDNDLDVEAACGGSSSCATCHVFVDAAWTAKLPPRSADEQELVEQTASYRGEASRLSCQIRFTPVLDGISLTVAPAE